MADESFIAHLGALRQVFIRCFAAVAILFAPAYLLTPFAIEWLISWSLPETLGSLYFFSPLEAFVARLRLAFVLALIFAFPYVLRQIWTFLLPALYENERRAFKGWIIASTALFAAGMAFCLLVIVPILMEFSLSFASDSLQPAIRLSEFLGLVGGLALAFGVVFQFPLAVMLAVRFGLVRVATLKDKRPYIIVLILIVATLVTPPDVASQLLMALPTWLLFEISLLFAARMEKPLEEEPEEKTEEEIEEETDVPLEKDGMLALYEQQAKKPKRRRK
ncbi:MAG: twin-arginine translocase subunit TatC [Alphaproteobacteria bacterium]|nr:twin-arginine translocase subunit TatC [Alphaproteobacteria bacterium]